MAATNYSIGTSNIINDIEAALDAKGLITSTLYKSTTCLIFSTPLTIKVIKILRNSGYSSTIYMMYGDSWSSGEAITNQINFLYNYASTSFMTAINLIVDTNFFVLIWQTGSAAYYGVGYVGSLDNGDTLAFGFSSGSSAIGNTAMNITVGVEVLPITFSSTVGFKDPTSGNLYTMPLMWARSTGELEMNGISPAETVGVKVSSVTSTGSNSIYGGNGYVLSPSQMYRVGERAIYSALLIEHTP